MKEIKVAVLGMGFIGKVHTYAYTSLPFFYADLPFKVKLAGVYNRTLDKARKAKEEYGFEFATDDMDDILQRSDIDAVSICLPNYQHAEAVVKAAERGLHIYCEKPLAANDAEAQSILQAVKGRDIRHQIVFHNRFFAAVMRAKRIIEEGRLGRILSFNASYVHPSNIGGGLGWKFDRQYACGGTLVDMGSHVLDMLYYLIGEYKSVCASMQYAYPVKRDEKDDCSACVEDAAYIIAEMKNGAKGTINVSKIATGSNDEFSVEIFGELGAVKFNLMDPNWVWFYDNTAPDTGLGGYKGFIKIEAVQRYEKPGGSFPSPKLPGGWLRAHVHSIYSFLDCVYQGKSCVPDLFDGAYIQRVMTAAYESDSKKAWVNV
jgi:predicted dehydrogenase